MVNPITKKDLERLDNQGQLLGLLKARAICSQSLDNLEKVKRSRYNDKTDIQIINMNINVVRGIMVEIDAVANAIRGLIK